MIRRRLAQAPGKVKVSFPKAVRTACGLSYAEVTRACDEAIKSLLLSGRSELSTNDLLCALNERRVFFHRPSA